MPYAERPIDLFKAIFEDSDEEDEEEEEEEGTGGDEAGQAPAQHEPPAPAEPQPGAGRTLCCSSAARLMEQMLALYP